LIGATVYIEELGKGTMSDLDGNFSIQNIPSGVYNVRFSFIGYDTSVESINMVGKSGVVDVSLNPVFLEIGEATVVAQANQQSATQMIALQKRSASVIDGVSSEVFSKTPDAKASDVFKRVGGVTIQENKFVIIRGLNDRYNFAYINGTPLPSTESDRRAFSFDLFPSNMIDNLYVNKSSSPDLSGEFSGGLININTTDPKEVTYQNFQIGTSFNTMTTFQDFGTYRGSPMDPIGLGSEFRCLPDNIPNTSEFVNLSKQERSELASLIQTDWSTYSRKAPVSSTFQYSVGKNYSFGSRTLLLSGAYNYSSQFNTTTTTRRDFEEQSLEVVQKMELNDSVFVHNIANSGLLNFSLLLNPNNTIKLKNFYTINSEDRVNVRQGVREMDNDPRQWERSTNFWYTQNNFLSQQLIGTHNIINSKLNWNLSYNNVRRDIPNLRRIVYRKYSLNEDDPNTEYTAVIQSNGTIPTAAGNMFWSYSDEDLYSAKLDWLRNITLGSFENEVKIGGMYQHRDRNFISRNLGYSQYKPQNGYFDSSLLLLDPSQIFSQENMGLLDNGMGGFKLDESTNVDDSYNANSTLGAGYTSFDTKYKSFRFIYGVRIENYNQNFFYTEFGSNKPIHINSNITDLLPSFNFVYTINEKTQLRSSVYSSVSRPEFRELAPFTFYNFIQDNIITGNPYLERTKINNQEVRFEFYPDLNEIFSISIFNKNLTNPIELINRTGVSGAPEIYYSNVESAFIRGIEFEGKINLIDNLNLTSNVSLVQSEVDLNGFEGSENGRPLQGQSPYVYNFGLLYNTQNNWNISASYNMVGPRIFIVGNIQEPSVWENGRNLIDFQVSKKFGNIEMKFNVRDLLSQDLVMFQDLNGNEKLDEGDNRWQETRMGSNVNFSLKYNFN
jgi:TonB-dependent receptor